MLTKLSAALAGVALAAVTAVAVPSVASASPDTDGRHRS